MYIYVFNGEFQLGVQYVKKQLAGKGKNKQYKAINKLAILKL
jgi:hypothetical protein